MLTEHKTTSNNTLKLRTVKRLYHGSDQKFESFDLAYARSFKDFGKGFYLTTDLKQAQKWAQSKASEKTEAYIYSYRLDTIKQNPDILFDFKVLELLQYDETWLNFICQSRTKGHETDYDIIYDRMADNKFNGISDILKKYANKEVSADKAIKYLQWNNETADQYCFKTERALSLLTDQKIYVQYKNDKGLWQHEQPLADTTER